MQQEVAMIFPFNQPESTRDCGYRCTYYAIQPPMPYEDWLDQFRFFDPLKNGIVFNDIIAILKYYNYESMFTQLSESGLFIIYSGVWMHQYEKKHGHYFVYHNGTVLCSTRPNPEKRTLPDILKHLEAKSIEGAFRCLKVSPKS
jgi:hypothetical protein